MEHCDIHDPIPCDLCLKECTSLPGLAPSVKQDGRLKAFRAFRAVKDQSLTALNTSHFTDVGIRGPSIQISTPQDFHVAHSIFVTQS
jgi:hypothetical protein